jgi:hypothetical protein
MEVKVSLTCEVRYHLIGFGDTSGYYAPKDFERVHDSLKGYNTDISHEVYEGTAIDKDGIVILVVITIINLDK